MARPKEFDKHEVLGKAICVFSDKGYNGTSMQDLVDGLGISRSTMYETFSNKHTLYVEALESYQKSAREQVYDIIKDSSGAKQAIQRLLEMAVSKLLDSDQQNGCLLINAETEVAAHDVGIKEMVCKSGLHMESVFMQIIVKGQEDGELSSRHNAKALARFITNTAKGLQVSTTSINDRTFFDDVIQTTLSLLD
jgi:TetR/AcrR family transcriptional repressor of nem operon